MTVRRLAPALAVLALVGVTACEKPAPQVTIASSGRVINVDASRYCFDECRDHDAAPKSIRIRGNTTVSIDVPKRVAEKGWVVQLGDQSLFQKPRKESHFSLSIPTIAQDQPVEVTILEAGGGAQPTGVWKMQFLVQE